MSTLAGIVDSGAGVIAILVAVAVGRFYKHLPGVTHEWAERLMIILMYAGGSAIAATELGSWARTAILWAAGMFGGLGAGLPHVLLVGGCLFSLLALVVALIVSPSGVTAAAAVLMPLILSLTSAGILHEAYTATAVPAQAFASAVASWIGG